MKKIMDNFTKEELQAIVNNNDSYTGCLRQMGYRSISGETCKKFQQKLQLLQIDTSNIDNYKPIIYNKSCSDEEVFKENSEVHQTTLRKHYLKLVPNNRCTICGISNIWNGKEMSMILDHINGHNHDNRLENLRWVCPNCNSLLDTTGSRNRVSKIQNYCCDCGKEISNNAIRCYSCNSKYNHVQLKQKQLENIPSKDFLKDLIRNNSLIEASKIAQTNPRTLGRWCELRGLPRTKKEINSYSDEKWAKI